MPTKGNSRSKSTRRQPTRGAAPARAAPAAPGRAPARRTNMAEAHGGGNGADQNVDQIRDILFGGQMRE